MDRPTDRDRPTTPAASAPEIAFLDAPLEAAIGATPAADAWVAFYRPAAAAGGALAPELRALEAASGGQIARALAEAETRRGASLALVAPTGLAAKRLILVALGSEDRDGPLDGLEARKLGAAVARALAAEGGRLREAHLRLEGLGAAVAAGLSPTQAAAELALGLSLRAYRFERHKSKAEDAGLERVALAGGGVAATAARAAHASLAALAEGVRLARDLVNEPANVLTPESFAERLRALAAHGLAVEAMGEARLEALGMRALLGVGRGSRRESHVVTLRWNGAPDRSANPICLVGKGVCFDSGGLSIKPAAGMEEMTMDMGGAAAVAGAMLALALSKAPVDVVGVVGLVENMPDGDAQRPGDIVVSMSGKTIEIVNTDAEGRLVLADLIWYAQETFEPRAIVDLATLTGAVIVALGHEYAGLFANDEPLAASLLAAAAAEGEGLWRLPLGKAYDKAIRSRLADMKNSGGRPAGAITGAQFIQRFVKPGQAWAHIDIAGVCLTKDDGPFWPKGPSGWGVATLVRLAREGVAAPARAGSAAAEAEPAGAKPRGRTSSAKK